MLLLAQGRVVPDYRVIEVVWPGNEPATAEAQLRTYIYGLRRSVGSGARIVRHPPGYRLETAHDQIDLFTFEQLIRDGRRAAATGRMEEAARRFAKALSLWRGPALSGVTEPLARLEQPRLEEARLAAVEDWADALLALGRHHELIPELTSVASQQPLRERLRAQLMVALYRSGMQADALSLFHDTRRILADELGIDPGAELRQVHAAILAADPALGAGGDGAVRIHREAPAEPGGRTRPVARRKQLPRNIPDFSGREKQIGQLCTLLKAPADRSAKEAPTVPVITGMPGVGKTALAVRVAHLCVEHYPDGQLYIDLRGDRPDPLSAMEALSRLLLMLGVDGSAIPDDLTERIRLYRDRLADQRILLLLDNAAGEGQVRPLLPHDPGCRAIVTSRTRLAALEGSQIFDLNVFERDSALELLGRVITSERVAADPRAAERILAMCGYLPLAVRIAAARLAARPHWPLARMARLLENHHRRLDELCFADLEIRAGLMLGYRGLPPTARHAFRLLSLPDVPHVGVWLAASLLDVPMETAEELLDSLVDAHLMEVEGGDGPGRFRYRFHDLVRVLARELAAEEGSEEENTAACDRALSAALHLARQADDRLPSQCFGVLGDVGPVRGVDPRALDLVASDPIAWFATEREGLVGMVVQAGALGRPRFPWLLAQALTNFFDLRGLYDDWSHTHQHALDAARRTGDRLGEAVMLRGLAERCAFLSDNATRLSYAQQALALFEQLGEMAGQADALYHCADVHRQTGHTETAIALLEQGLRRATDGGHLVGEAQAREGLGKVHTDQGRLEEALRDYERSAAIWQGLGRHRYRALITRSIGIIERELGRYPAAALRFEECLAAFRDVGDRVGEAYTRNSLGDLCRKWGSTDRARVQYEQAISIFTDLGLQRHFGHAVALRGLGALDLAAGRLDSAIDQLTRSLGLWRELDMPVWEARTLLILGEAHAMHGDSRAARDTWQTALILCQRLGLPEAAELALRLTTAKGSTAGA
ncbi:AfsR/SARP family transcriptional regulator [Actinoallomurus soli]|uniref:AfsR/SARP family transcriptional regulator n=1 Tax=Actinoallomurus soli TaxID=2952535 RepID=UPI0020932A43|nr:BTAD domain-containing putative transcriptional regulator [Actinoallomurus soli]MCO5972479.1 tetratricopeptide repeat protein [Actinoallomurus soli]